MAVTAEYSKEYSNIYVFGDSLSDIGNLRAVTQDPSIPDRFSNGRLSNNAVDYGYTNTTEVCFLMRYIQRRSLI